MWENDYEGMENWENFEKVTVSEEILVMLFLTFYLLLSSDPIIRANRIFSYIEEIQDWLTG